MTFTDSLDTAGKRLQTAGKQLRAAAAQTPTTPDTGFTYSFDAVFTPDWPTRDINAAMWDISQRENGGHVHFDGQHTVTEPLVRAPGLNVTCAGYPNPWNRSRTTFIRAFTGGAVWDFVDKGRHDENFGPAREAWWGGKVTGLQVDANQRDGADYRLVGGNRSIIDTFTSIGTCEYWFVIDEGRNYDAQYSWIRNFSCKRFEKVGLDVRRGSPDNDYEHGMIYSDHRIGSTAIKLHAGSGTSSNANNQGFNQVHMQFCEVGLDVDSDECLYTGGSWENGAGDPLISNNAYAVKIGPNVRWFVMDKTSFANKTSVKALFHIDPAARRLRFRDLTGVNEADVPAGMERYFDIIPN